jgi:hypothetical protein
LIPRPASSEGWLAVFHIYVDESGKLASKDDYTCLSGFLGHETQWDYFSEMWKACRLKWGIPPLHMSRVVSPTRKQDEWTRIYESWGTNWIPMRDDMLVQFASIIDQAGLVALGTIVDAKKYRVKGGVKQGHCGGAKVGQWLDVRFLGVSGEKGLWSVAEEALLSRGALGGVYFSVRRMMPFCGGSA